MIRGTRVLGVVKVAPSRWQATCSCKWAGQHHRSSVNAEYERRIHKASCGLCQRHGREYMAECSCWNCANRRDWAGIHQS